jgi:hypothetical protein
LSEYAIGTKYGTYDCGNGMDKTGIPYYGMGLHHLIYSTNTKITNAIMGDDLYLRATKDIDVNEEIISFRLIISRYVISMLLAIIIEKSTLIKNK